MKTATPEEAKQKIRRYCAYQERSHLEVRTKLYSYGLHRGDVEAITVDLITDGYLNEERFAKAYAGGKFRMKKWGRVKIVHALEAKGVSANCIKIGMREIDDESYAITLRNLLEEKLKSLDSPNNFVLRNKLSTFAISKGYESELVWREVRDLIR